MIKIVFLFSLALFLGACAPSSQSGKEQGLYPPLTQNPSAADLIEATRLDGPSSNKPNKRAYLYVTRSNANAEVNPNTGYTILHWAARRRNEPLVRSLLENGANPNIRNWKGIHKNTPAEEALGAEREDLAKLITTYSGQNFNAMIAKRNRANARSAAYNRRMLERASDAFIRSASQPRTQNNSRCPTCGEHSTTGSTCNRCKAWASGVR